jgi:hypothetical protein
MKRAALLAMVIAMAFVPAASASGRANTKVTLDGIFTVPIETHFDGDVKSTRKACKNDRKVKIFRKRSGADKKIGSTRSYKGLTSNTYHWSHVEDGVARAGNYYAKVKRTDKCKKDRSGTVYFSG